MTRNGHIVAQSFADSKGRTLRLTDGRLAVLHNETKPKDGQLYLVGEGKDQAFRVYRAQTHAKGFTLVPEEGEPVGIEPDLLMLFRVVDSDQPPDIC